MTNISSNKINGDVFNLIEIYKDLWNDERCEHCNKKIKNVCVVNNELGQVFHLWKNCFEKIVNKKQNEDEILLEIKEWFDLIKKIEKAQKIVYNNNYFILSFWKKNWSFVSITKEFDKIKGINFNKIIKEQWKWYKKEWDSLFELVSFLDNLLKK